MLWLIEIVFISQLKYSVYTFSVDHYIVDLFSEPNGRILVVIFIFSYMKVIGGKFFLVNCQLKICVNCKMHPSTESEL